MRSASNDRRDASTILLVEDDPTLLSTLAFNLSRQGYQVLTADNGERALKMVAPTGDAIVSSPLSRAFDTARAIGDALGINEIATDADLQERSYGVAEGLTLVEREARWPEGNWPGLEEWDHVAIRAMRALGKVALNYSGERVFVVCHGGLINSILAVLSDGELGTGKTTIINTSITTLTLHVTGWHIDSVNQTPHLDLNSAYIR